MAVDDDDSEDEVDGNGAMGDDDGYVSYYNIVKLILLLICLHYNFYTERCCRRESKHREGHSGGLWRPPPPCHPRVAPSRRINGDGQRRRGRPDEDKDDDDNVAPDYADGGIRRRPVQCLLL